MNLEPNRKRKELFVEKALWELTEAFWQKLIELKTGFKDKDHFVSRFLPALEELGRATCTQDTPGKLVYVSTPKLLAETGKQLGSIESRDYYTED